MTDTIKLRPTPETDAAWKEAWILKASQPNSDPAHGMLDKCESLERERDELIARLFSSTDEAERYLGVARQRDELEEALRHCVSLLTERRALLSDECRLCKRARDLLDRIDGERK